MEQMTVERWKKWIINGIEDKYTVEKKERSIEAKGNAWKKDKTYSFQQEMMEEFQERTGYTGEMICVYSIAFKGEKEYYAYVMRIGEGLIEIKADPVEDPSETPSQIISLLVDIDNRNRRMRTSDTKTLSQGSEERLKEFMEAVQYYEENFGKNRLRYLLNN